MQHKTRHIFTFKKKICFFHSYEKKNYIIFDNEFRKYFDSQEMTPEFWISKKLKR